MGVMRISAHSLTSDVGIGCRPQDLDGEDFRILSRLSSDTGVKEDSVFLVELGLVTEDGGVFVKEASQGIKVLMTQKTGSFIGASNEVRFQDICSEVWNIYLVNFTDGNMLKLTGLSDRKNKAIHDWWRIVLPSCLDNLTS